MNAIAPGYIADTRFFAEDDQTDRQNRPADLVSSGRVGRPDDIDALAAFSVAPDSDHIRGQVLHVNGGQHLAG